MIGNKWWQIQNDIEEEINSMQRFEINQYSSTARFLSENK